MTSTAIQGELLSIVEQMCVCVCVDIPKWRRYIAAAPAAKLLLLVTFNA